MDLRFPVAKFYFEGEITNELIEGWIKGLMKPLYFKKSCGIGPK